MKWIAAILTVLVLFSMFIGCGKNDDQQEERTNSFGQKETNTAVAEDTEKLMTEAKQLKAEIEKQQGEFEQLGMQMQQAAVSGDTDKQNKLADEMKKIGAEIAESSARLKVVLESLQKKGADLSEL